MESNAANISLKCIKLCFKFRKWRNPSAVVNCSSSSNEYGPLAFHMSGVQYSTCSCCPSLPHSLSGSAEWSHTGLIDGLFTCLIHWLCLIKALWQCDWPLMEAVCTSVKGGGSHYLWIICSFVLYPSRSCLNAAEAPWYGPSCLQMALCVSLLSSSIKPYFLQHSPIFVSVGFNLRQEESDPRSLQLSSAQCLDTFCDKLLQLIVLLTNVKLK